MVAKEGPDITKFLIWEKGYIISELLVIVSGTGGNSLISIKEDIDMKNISDRSKNIDIQELNSLDKIDNKKPEE
jgi:hypothetical protein